MSPNYALDLLHEEQQIYNVMVERNDLANMSGAVHQKVIESPYFHVKAGVGGLDLCIGKQTTTETVFTFSADKIIPG